MTSLQQLLIGNMALVGAFREDTLDISLLIDRQLNLNMSIRRA